MSHIISDDSGEVCFMRMYDIIMKKRNNGALSKE